MLQFPKERDLTNGSRRDSLVFMLKSNFLQSNEAAVGFVAGLVDDTICAFANLFQLLVALQRGTNLGHLIIC